MDSDSGSSSGVEELAAQYGWNKEGEKTAEEYIKVALEKFPDQSKKIKQLFKALDDVKVHLTKTEQVAYDRAKKELDAQRVTAIREGDVEAVERIDKEKEQLVPMVQAQDQVHPAILDFEERNSKWLNGTSFEELKMVQWMESHAAVLGKRRLPPEEHMSLLEEHVKLEFPDYFGSTKVKSPVLSSRSSVASADSGTKKKTNIGFDDLSPEQKRTAQNFKNLGVMSIEDYIKDLVKHGEV